MVKTALKKTRRYKGRTADELRAERRNRLLQAGLKLFSERGYANAPIELICSTARVTTRHFYEQFKGREELLKALFLQIVDEAAQSILATLQDEEQPVQDRMTHAVRAGTDYLLADPRRARIACIETIGVSKEMELLRRNVVRNLARAVEQYCNHLVAAGLIPQRDYHLPAIALVGATLELLVESLSENSQLSPADYGRELVLIFRALLIGAQRYGEA